MRYISTALTFLFVAASASASGVAQDDPLTLIRTLMTKVDDLSADRDAIKSQVKALSADRDALTSKVEALTHEVASLKNKKSKKFPTVPEGSKHVRRGLQGNVADMSMSYEADMSLSSLADEPEELSFGMFHDLMGKVEALLCCIDYNPSNGGTCYVGGDADAVKVRAKDYVYLGAGHGHSGRRLGAGHGQSGDKSGLKIADDVKLFSEHGRVDVDAGTDLKLRADVNERDYEDGSVHVSTKGGNVNVYAGKNLTCMADVNGYDSTQGSAYIGVGNGEVGNKAGLKIAPARVNLFSNSLINVTAWTNLTMRAGFNESNMNDGEKVGAYLGTGDGADSEMSTYAVAMKEKANGQFRHTLDLYTYGEAKVKAGTNLIARAGLRATDLEDNKSHRAYLGTGDGKGTTNNDAYVTVLRRKTNNGNIRQGVKVVGEQKVYVHSEEEVQVLSDASDGVKVGCDGNGPTNVCAALAPAP